LLKVWSFFCKQSKPISHYSNFYIFVLDLRMHFQKISLALHDVCSVHKWTIVDCQCIRYRSLSLSLWHTHTHTHTHSFSHFFSLSPWVFVSSCHALFKMLPFHFSLSLVLRPRVCERLLHWRVPFIFTIQTNFFSVRKIEFHCHVLNCCTSQHWFLA